MIEKELVKIVGEINVIFGPQVLEEYSKDLSFIPQMEPESVVRPANIGELKQVVKWANATSTPLIPVSSGSPRFRGDTVPSVNRSVIVDLRRMNKIIKVDSVNKVAIIEPGVTFGKLQEELAKGGMRAYLPLAPRSSKSVIGSVLEKEPIMVPGQHWDSTDPMLCIELVLGTGDSTRTGEAAGPDPLEKQWEIGKAQLSPFGPTQMDIQRLVSGAQGTIGIVTWMSIKTRFLPKISKAFLIPSRKIDPLIELCYKLTKPRLGEELFIVNGINLANLVGNDAQEIQKLSKSLPPWLLFAAFDGYDPLPQEKVDYQEADLIELAKSFGLTPATDVQGVKAEALRQLLQKPSDEPYWKLRFKGGFQEIPFLTMMDKTPGFVAEMSELANTQMYDADNIGVYIQPIVQGTGCHIEFNLFYNPDKPEEGDATRKLMDKAADNMEKKGAFFSRPYSEFAKIAYRSCEDNAIMQRKIKKIFDPNGILNPGKLCF